HPAYGTWVYVYPSVRRVCGTGVVQRVNTGVWTDHEGSDLLAEGGSMGYVWAGWPCLALWGAADDLGRGTTWKREWLIKSPLKPVGLTKHRDGWRDLPAKPIWPGFAINTIFYAAVLWLPFAALGRIRRSRRTKRGLCPTCAYDLRGGRHSACPECGAAVCPP